MPDTSGHPWRKQFAYYDPGSSSWRMWPDTGSLGFDSVLADLAEMRYVGSWCSLRASDVGAPHRRERLFIVAHPAGQPWCIDQRNGHDLYAALTLLPTPAASDGARGPDYARIGREGSGGDDLITTVFRAMESSQWGKYGPAIRRWESITRQAPSPIELGPKGAPRLAARFSEWMQGWPLGWVTHVAISRSAMLRIIGNGVVPQQAIAALYWLLSVWEMAA